MKKFLIAAAALIGLSMPASAAGVNIGTLACQVESGIGYFVASSRDAICAFHPVHGREQYYAAKITRVGVDVGFTNGTSIVWAVIAPGNIKHGALKGQYIGATAEATLGVGVGANFLVGGVDKSFSLQPISVQGQVGLDLALAGTTLHLTPIRVVK